MRRLALIFLISLLSCTDPGSGRITKITEHFQDGETFYTITVIDSAGKTYKSPRWETRPPMHIGDHIKWSDVLSRYGEPFIYDVRKVTVLEEETPTAEAQ